MLGYVRAKEDLVHVKRVIEKGEIRADGLDRELAQLDAKLSSELAAMQAALQEESSAVAAAQAKAEEVNAVLSKTITSVTSLAACVSSLSSNRERVDDFVERCHQELASSRHERAAMHKRMDQLEMGFRRVSEENDLLRAQLGLLHQVSGGKMQQFVPAAEAKAKETDSAAARLMTIILEHERLRRVAAEQQERIESLTGRIESLTVDLLDADRRFADFQREETARVAERLRLEGMCRALASKLSQAASVKDGEEPLAAPPVAAAPTTGLTPSSSLPPSPCDPSPEEPSTPEQLKAAPAAPEPAAAAPAPAAEAKEEEPAAAAGEERAEAELESPAELASLHAASAAFARAVAADAVFAASGEARRAEGDAGRPELARLGEALDVLVAAGSRGRSAGLLGRRRAGGYGAWELLHSHATGAEEEDARRSEAPLAPYAAAAAAGRELTRILSDMVEASAHAPRARLRLSNQGRGRQVAAARGELKGRSALDVRRAQLAAFVRGALKCASASASASASRPASAPHGAGGGSKRVLSETVHAALEHHAAGGDLAATHEPGAPISLPSIGLRFEDRE
eukprot:tig00000262_g23081.t1